MNISLNVINLSAVSILEVDNITASYASLDWDDASPTSVYNISYSSDGGVTWVDIVGHTGSYINLSGLSPSTTYEVEITSTAYGCESDVFTGSFTTILDCITPENIEVDYNLSDATITWDEVIGSLSYEILYNFGSGYTSVYTESNSITLPLSGATNNIFYIRVHCTDGQSSAWSEIQSFILTCDAPYDIVASNSGTNLTIDWEGSAPLYRLIYNVGYGWTNVYPTSSEYSIPNVSVGTNVTFYIRSICDDETNFFSSWSLGTYTTVSGERLLQEISFDVNVYPNPTNGLFNISFDEAVDQPIDILLVDAFGKEVYNKRFDINLRKEVIDIDISSYAKGIYILKLICDDTVKSERIILQ